MKRKTAGQRPQVQTRAELFERLQARMDASYRELLDDQRLDFKGNLVKSYVIESDLHRRPMEEGETALDFIQNAFLPKGVPPGQFKVFPTEEEDFFEARLSTSRGASTIYIDASTDRRFWLVYSLSESRHLDWWLERSVLESPRLDYIWLWPRALESHQSMGLPRGFGLDYDYRRFDEPESEQASFLKMQIWGGLESDRLYQYLKDAEKGGLLVGKVVLSKVRMKVTAEGESADDASQPFVIEDLKYMGKFTSRGNSLGLHNAILNRVRENYRTAVEDIERKYAIRSSVVEGNRMGVEGYGINFIPDGREIPVELFYRKVFAGAKPFRLFGLAGEENKDYRIVDAVDLHTGDRLGFELSPEMLTMYLPEGACGNTVVRFLTNLQHYFSSKFRVETDNGDVLFQ